MLSGKRILNKLLGKTITKNKQAARGQLTGMANTIAIIIIYNLY